MIIAFGTCQLAAAQGTSPLTFEVPAAQQAQFGAVSSDPTIRPFSGSGVPQSPLLSWSADLQGNGRPDVILCYGSLPPDPEIKQPCRVLRPQADGSVIDVTRQLFGNAALPSMVHPREFVAGDFNGDGRTDIFIAAHGYDGPPFPGETNVLLIANPDGTYADRSSTLPQTPGFSHSACAGDVNGDGRSDIYVGNLDIRGPYLLLGNGDGTFRQTRSGLPPSFLPVPPNAAAIERSLACVLIDVDADGFTDLVLGAWSQGGIAADSVIYLNDGAGDFTKRPRLVLPTGPFGERNTDVLDIVTLDVNRDGRPDLILVSQYLDPAQFVGFGLQVLINKGAGIFADETAARLPAGTSRPTGPYCTFVRLADFNGDGWEDFYCATNSWTDAEPCIWLNQGNGAWTGIPGRAMPQGSNCSGVHAVDFDGDGRPDLLQSGSNKDADVFYRSFLNRTPRTVPSEPLISNATAGDAQASIAFTPPLASGSSPITGYTATCALGTYFGSATTAAGVASPITVRGLANGRTYACSVTATSAAGTSLPSRVVSVRPAATRLDLNQHGLTGFWYEAATSGQGIGFEVFPNPASGTGSTFLTWFTYDTVAGGAERQRWYSAQGPVATGQPNAALTIYQNTGGNFNAPPATNAQAVGTATLSFDTCSSGQLSYTFTDGTGRVGTIPLTRLMQNVTCSTANSYPTHPDFALSGHWYAPATSGQGFAVEVNASASAFFAAWYTYFPNGTAAGAAGQRWYSAQAAFAPGSRSVPVTIYETTGGVFDTLTPSGQRTVPVGTGTMSFQSCTAATFSYTFTGASSSGLSGTINLMRVGPAPPGCAQ